MPHRIQTTSLGVFSIHDPQTDEKIRIQIHKDPSSGHVVGFDEKFIDTFDEGIPSPFKKGMVLMIGLPTLQQNAFPSVVTPPEVFDSTIALAAFRHCVHRNGHEVTDHCIKYLSLHWKFFSAGERFEIKMTTAESLSKGEHTPLEIAEWQKILDLPDDPHVLKTA